MADSEQGDRFVELGCGESPSAELGRGTIAIGVDLDIDKLRLARQSVPRWSVVCADARFLPLQASSVDHVWLRAVLHHLVPLPPVLTELARVLRPAGSVTVIDGVALDEADAASLDSELACAGLDAEPVYGFDLDELTALIEAAGLQVEQLLVGGTATFATPPHVSKTYTSDRFTLTARQP